MSPEIWNEKWSMIGIVVSPGGKGSWAGKKKRDYVDPKGNRYTVLGKWIADQYLYQISKTRKNKWRKAIGWPYFQSEQEAQAHLDVYADDEDNELFLDREFDHYKLEDKRE